MKGDSLTRHGWQFIVPIVWVCAMFVTKKTNTDQTLYTRNKRKMITCSASSAVYIAVSYACASHCEAWIHGTEGPGPFPPMNSQWHEHSKDDPPNLWETIQKHLLFLKVTMTMMNLVYMFDGIDPWE